MTSFTLRRLPLLLILSIFAGCWRSTRTRNNRQNAVNATETLSLLSKTELPRHQDVCFSPVQRCDLKLLKLIDSSQSSIDIAIYDMNLPPLIQQLSKKSKNVKVRILADRRQAKGDHSRLHELVNAGPEVRFGKQRGIFHHKFVIIDGKFLETGSFNFTNNAAKNNQENQLYLTTPEIVAQFQAQFERMWAEGKSAAM